MLLRPPVLAIVGLLALATPDSRLDAQSLAPGERVRLRTLTDRGVLTGTLVTTSEDSLVLAVRRDEHRIALHRIRTLERYAGQSRAGGLARGVLNGGLGATLLALGYHALSSASREASAPPPRAAVILFAGAGATVGGALGLWIGTERWERLR